MQTTIEKIKPVRAIVNERRFFETMKHLFADSSSVLGELLQNARRAGATRIKIDFDRSTKTLCVLDDGCGIDDFQNLLSLATTGWDNEKTILEDKPFGMGFFSVLYAAAGIVIESNGKHLSIKLSDIVNQCEMLPVVNGNAPAKGTRITLSNITDELAGEIGPGRMDNLEMRLQRMVIGFSLPVELNGVELDRPHAVANLNVEHTEVGDMMIPGIHQTKNHDTISAEIGYLYLQGLPIQDQRWYGEPRKDKIVIHLDSASFTAQMPDRKNLYDGLSQICRINDAISQTIKKYLVAQKATLDPAEFVKKHWVTARSVKAMHLFNDNPYLPRDCFQEIVSAVISTDYENTTDAPWSHNQLVSRQDLLSGAVRAWRNVKTDAENSPWASAFMVFMHKQDILAFEDHSSRIDAGHWVYSVIPSVTAMTMRVEIEEPGEKCEVISFDCASAEIRNAKSVRMTVSSGEVQEEVIIDTGWVVLPSGHLDSNEEVEDEDTMEKSYACFLMDNDKSSWGHPVNAVATFYSEHDMYDENAETEAKGDWDTAVALLNNATLAWLANHATSDSWITFSDSNCKEIALMTVKRYANGERSNKMQAIDMADVIEQIATTLTKKTGQQVDGADILAAMQDAVYKFQIKA